MFNPLFIIESVEYTIPPVGSPIAEKTHMVSACLQHTKKNEQYKLQIDSQNIRIALL